MVRWLIQRVDGLVFFLFYIIPKRKTVTNALDRMKDGQLSRDVSYSIYLEQFEYAKDDRLPMKAAALLLPAVVQDPFHSSSRIDSLVRLFSEIGRRWWMHKYLGLFDKLYRGIPECTIRSSNDRRKVTHVLETICQFRCGD